MPPPPATAGRVKDLTQTCFYVWPVLYASLYGRFLLLQLDNVGSVVIMNFMFACFAIMGNLTDRGSDYFWLAWVYGDRAAEAMQAVRVSPHPAVRGPRRTAPRPGEHACAQRSRPGALRAPRLRKRGMRRC